MHEFALALDASAAPTDEAGLRHLRAQYFGMIGEVGRMVGLDLPVVSLQHQYLVTEAIPEIEAHGRPLPLVRDPEMPIITPARALSVPGMASFPPPGSRTESQVPAVTGGPQPPADGTPRVGLGTSAPRPRR